ncbi:hypothetical protein TBC1_1117 [Lentimicrobium saccharophilum]|uniref:Uncharacterized protein n=1 Tax=Lentimicrobium saccharophilum TaxID=1678841 RepID=A0A0S7BZM2_9BACT|nr:hypothetical protein TBC1_1117 [Lentimicrobium saccharophilum]
MTSIMKETDFGETCLLMSLLKNTINTIFVLLVGAANLIYSREADCTKNDIILFNFLN